ncbi:hypothetical protein JK364_23175 [Streptomyces sp. 110]|uniref:Uncharacterized protein n=1 Tax=Streptomyces endocoffeicus TaxID=2898945 RepID=A0ABS1PS65_9ACTN|nr:hypothetical protein [Streptomyces endocoffeicus]MBL1115277.1 hypothetical protein [Streptomyces endocoffeicus]
MRCLARAAPAGPRPLAARRPALLTASSPDGRPAGEVTDRGAQFAGDLIDEGQDLIASSASFVAGALSPA